MMRTQVGIVGAGPAGLVLAALLRREGIESVVLEARSRAHVESRVRAGVLEQGTVDLLAELGLDGRLRREGMVHEGVEWRFEGRAHRIPVAALTGGQTVTVYGQQELVKDLIAARLAGGEPLLFDVAGVEIDGLLEDEATIRFQHDGAEHELRCDVVAGCDGFHGASRAAAPRRAIEMLAHAYPFAWLAVLAEAAPSTDEVIYCHHERGFALHSMRSPTLSRLYLQCDPGDDVSAWPEERIWAELHTRLATDDGWTLAEGRILQRAITPLRSFMARPMQHGRLYLCGDAAHIVPPTGAKGLNLAVGDALVLAEALAERYGSGSRALLAGYTDTCLPRVWAVQRFAARMTSLFHRWDPASAFERELQVACLRHVCFDTDAARELAEGYVGARFAPRRFAVRPAAGHPASAGAMRAVVGT